VIYSPLAYQIETHKYKPKHHNTVLFNTITWDPHPYASPEGLGTTPSEQYQRWSTEGPLEAAMRLTALRQPPKDISKPKNSRQPKPELKPSDNLHPQLLRNYKPVPPDAGNGKSTSTCTAPYGGAVNATRKPAHSYHWSEPPPLKDSMLVDLKPSKKSPHGITAQRRAAPTRNLSRREIRQRDAASKRSRD
jgi:hypothetical protein